MSSIGPDSEELPIARSQKSRDLCRNFFVWSTRSDLLGGLYIDSERNAVTVAELHRWIDLVIRKRYQTTFNAHYVKLTYNQLHAFMYDYKLLPEALDSKPNDLLRPGYVMLVGPADSRTPVVFSRSKLSFYEQEQRSLEDEDTTTEERNECRITDDFIRKVIERDGNRCVFTDTEDVLTATFICPPLIKIQGDLSTGSGNEDPAPYLQVTNGLTVCQKIVDMFRQNQLGVDVDDNYRIRFFGPHNNRTLIEPSLRTNLGVKSIDTTMQGLLKEHFVRCLHVNFVGGDIKEGFEEQISAEDIANPNLGDDVWKTPRGEATLPWSIWLKATTSTRRGDEH